MNPDPKISDQHRVELKQQLIDESLAQQVLKFGEFTLKSGRISPYFFNAGLFNNGKALTVLAENYAHILASILLKSPELQGDFLLFGPAYKGIPLVAATACILQTHYNLNVPWAFNRKEAKAHGEGGVLVGAPVTGKKVWIIDDVITAGTAIREVIQLLDASEAQVAGILVALDRQERGTGRFSAIQELQQQYDMPVFAVMTLADIMSYVEQQGDRLYYDKLKAYQTTYGAEGLNGVKG